jgi:hypothetical protein
MTALNEDHWGLVIAISRYRYFDRLNSPGADAARFSSWLLERGGVPQSRIVLVDSGSESGKPDAASIIDGFRDLGALMKVRRGQRLYIYYAGHGFGPEFDDAVMVPADVQRGMLRGACISVRDCVNFIRDTGLFDQVVMFVDCCRDNMRLQPPHFWPFEDRSRFEGAREQVSNFILFGAIDGGKSWEVRPPGREFRGIMTDALLDALNGHPAAFDAQNRITANTVGEFVRIRVQAEVERLGLQQAPQPKPSGQEDIVFLQSETAPTLRVTFHIGPQSAGQMVTLENIQTGIETSKPAGASGSKLDFDIAGNSVHVITVDQTGFRVILNPMELGSDQDAELP